MSIEESSDIEELVVSEDQRPKRRLRVVSAVTLPKQVVSNLPLVKSEIISASRRTDIPAFYMNSMVQSMYSGAIEVTSPYGQKSLVSLSSADVKCFAWWSKDYRHGL